MIRLHKILLVLMWVFFARFSYAQQSVTVCVIGDAGTGTSAQYKVADAMLEAECQHILYAGDIIYNNGAKSENDYQWVKKFERPFKKLIDANAIFYSSIGNHDYRAGSSKRIGEIHSKYAKKHKFYYFPDLYYKFQLENVCFWAVDTNNFDKKQTEFLSKSMRNSKSCIWKVAFGHHPIKSSGVHGNTSGRVKQNLKPVLIDFADIYFAGHDHNLADEGYVPNAKGFRQIVSGAGAQVRSVWWCEIKKCSFAKSTLGFVKAVFKGAKVEISFIDSDNNILHKTHLSN